MKTYIGTKTVSAQPMSAKEALNNNYKIGDHKEDEDGYEVMYEDGYTSWSPKDVFVKSYRLSETYIDRLKLERNELLDKLNKLSIYLSDNKDKELYGQYAQNRTLMNVQRDVMKMYVSILCQRLELEKEYNPYQSITPTERQLGNKQDISTKN